MYNSDSFQLFVWRSTTPLWCDTQLKVAHCSISSNSMLLFVGAIPQFVELFHNCNIYERQWRLFFLMERFIFYRTCYLTLTLLFSFFFVYFQGPIMVILALILSNDILTVLETRLRKMRAYFTAQNINSYCLFLILNFLQSWTIVSFILISLLMLAVLASRIAIYFFIHVASIWALKTLQESRRGNLKTDMKVLFFNKRALTSELMTHHICAQSERNHE